MKLKIFFLILGSSLLTYIIFTTNINNTITITSIYDKTTIMPENFNTYLKEYLNNSIGYTYYEYANDNLEIENVIDAINENKNNIQEKIHNSKVLIVYLGEFELQKENFKLDELVINLNELFVSLRKLNNYQIIYISPYSMKSSYALKDLCKSKNIDFISLSNYFKNTDLLNKSSQTTLAKVIKDTIFTAWKYNEK